MTGIMFVSVMARVIEVLLEFIPRGMHDKALLALEGWIKRRRATIAHHEAVNAEVAKESK